MGPKNFKDFDKRRYHIKDIEDVIEWYNYSASRNQEALKVIRGLRNSYNIKESVIKSYQQKEDREFFDSLAEVKPVQEAGAVKEVKPTAVEDNAILAELEEVLEAEKEKATAEGAEEASSEDGVDVGDYSVFYVKGSPRFRNGSMMVKAVEVPENIREKLLEDGES